MKQFTADINVDALCVLCLGQLCSDVRAVQILQRSPSFDSLLLRKWECLGICDTCGQAVDS